MRLYDVVPGASGEHPHPRPAIATAALAKLVPLAGNRYRGTAARTVAALADNHLNSHGALVDGCYNRVKNVATSNVLHLGRPLPARNRSRPQRRLDPTDLQHRSATERGGVPPHT